MNRSQRKCGKVPKKSDSEAGLRPLAFRNKNESRIEEVLSPRTKRDSKPMMLDRCCCISPAQRSFGQLTEETNSPDQDYETLIAQQYGSILPDLATIAQLQELRKVLCCSSQAKTENASQYSISQLESFDACYRSTELIDNGVQWQNVDDANEVDNILFMKRDEETLTQYHSLPKNFHISEVPTVKIIAEKFTKYKKNTIELRKLEEKVVCVEYDIFEKEADALKLVQRMRAFFSIKPVNDEKENVLTELPKTIKNKFNISSGDLRRLNQKEIEIVDGKILENQPYLEDLRKILRRGQNSPKKSKTTLNLHSLYDLARRGLLEYETDFGANSLTNDEMLEVQNFILKNCKSSVHGIRRTVKNTSASDVGKEGHNNISSENTISQSLMKELLKADGLQ